MLKRGRARRSISRGIWLALIAVVITPHAGYVCLFLRSWSQHGWALEHLTTLLFLWQTQTGAAFALVAALIGAAAIWQQTQAQLAAAADKDRLQSYGIALGVYPGLLDVEEAHKRAAKSINEEWPKTDQWGAKHAIAAHVRDAGIPVPPILNRSFDNLYLLGEAGQELLQLVGLILRYDGLLEKLARNIEQEIVAPHLKPQVEPFKNRLDLIGQALREAEPKLALIHDQTVPPEQTSGA
jgi:hypothetical protein